MTRSARFRSRCSGFTAASLRAFGLALAGTLAGHGAGDGVAFAQEGQWMPQQIAELPREELQRLGMDIDPAELWGGEKGGLMRAVVNLSGCSAGFVSPEGLVATNHHCAYRAIQSNSSVEHDYLKDGFLAGTRDEELDSKGTTVKVLMAVEDVTERVRKAGEGLEDPVARARAVDLASKKIVQTCEEEDAANRCRVAAFYNGSLVQLHRYVEFEDVRLVYAPPSSIGNYGGEVDNWMWPRHTGDFSLMRVYATPEGKPAPYSKGNVPYRPERWLAPSPDGVAPGDFVAVLGFPGHTDRYLPAVEVRRQLEQFLPARVDLYGEWIEILEAAGARDPAVKIKVAATLRSLANRHKNARGMIDGIRRNGILARREKEEAELAKWAATQGERYAGVLEDLQALSDARRSAFDHAFAVANVDNAAGSLAAAIDLVRRAREANKPDLERDDAYMDRAKDELWRRMERRLRDYDRATDTALLEALFRRIEALPAEQRFSSTKAAGIGSILARTKVMDEAFLRETFDAADADAIEKSRDPLIALARELVVAIEARELESDREEGLMLELGPKYFEMLRAARGGVVYPDANGTLRFSYAQVTGYSPRDGLTAVPQTVLAGQVAKHTGEEPFDLPAPVREAAELAGATYWSDPALDDVPVCFLSNADTTGGNSGSPVIDGKGRWVGLNFDRVWENIAGDFGYSTERSRNITVDVRYLLWNLDRVADAGALLTELGVADKRDASPRPRTAGSGARPVDGPPVSTKVGGPRTTPSESPARGGEATASCQCRASDSRRDGALAWMIAALSLVGARSRRRIRPWRSRTRAGC
jgi:hypothetical protein